jgi:hypothetical protein
LGAGAGRGSNACAGFPVSGHHRRRERTAQIQGTSQQNTWMREATDPDWVYGYDAWMAPLDAAPHMAEVAARPPYSA